MPGRLPREVKVHLEKARESALLAVDIYNKPGTAFRSGGFIVLMCVAWTALFHAIFLKMSVKPFYRDSRNARRYARIDGDYRAWDLSYCTKQYYGSRSCAEQKNLLFFVGLRNKIEHRSMPSLDVQIFGECQALLFNFEDLLCREFGTKYALNESLSFALQFSHQRAEAQARAQALLHRPLATNVARYIDQFRSGLAADELNDPRFSFKVFLVPKVVNHPSDAALAVEFVPYDPTNPEEMQKYQRLVALIKTRTVPVANQGRLLPKDICRAVEQVVRQAVGPQARFTPSHHHVKAYRYYGVRPTRGCGDPRNTVAKYCQYDEAHGDYVYTEAWREFLTVEMAKPGQYELIIGGRSTRDQVKPSPA